MVKRILLTVMACLILFGSVQAKVIEVNTLERIVIMSMLPVEASYSTWGIINDLRKELSFTDEEVVRIDMQTDAEGSITADWESVDPKEIDFGTTATRFIEDALLELSEAEKLLPEHVSIYKKFLDPDPVTE